MDRRRKRVSGVPGTLWTLKNAFISRGGDIVRAKKFVSAYTLPAGTNGLAAVKGQLYVFGEAAAPTMPVDVQYQRLQGVGAELLTRVLDAKPFDGLIYAIAEYDDGSIYHFYDGTRITSWDTIADANSSYKAVAERLGAKINASSAVTAKVSGAVINITARVAGTAFTLTTGTTDGASTALSVPTAATAALVANVPGVVAVVATGSVTILGGSSAPGVNQIDDVTVNGVSLLANPVNWVLSNAATANVLASAILSNSIASGYTAVAVGTTVTISAAVGTGATPNGYVVAATTGGTVTASTANMAGGVTAVTAVAQVSKVTIAGTTFDGTDTWAVTVNATTYQTTGRAAGMGTSAWVYRGRVYCTARSLIVYCKLDNATDWTTTAVPASDAGNINITTHTEGPENLVAISNYNGSAAIFGQEAVPIYTLSADATANAIADTLNNTGLLAARAAVPYGNTDLFYLDQSGIRSIRSRDGYNAAFVGDVGSAVDDFVQDIMAAEDDDTVSRAVGVIDPLEGRYLLALGDYVMALSYYPNSKITAWSYLDLGYAITDMVRAKRRLYVRSGNTIYVYGGVDGRTYPGDNEQNVLVEFPFMAANDPAGLKDLTGFDMACENEWQTDVLINPNDEAETVEVGVINRVTYNGPTIAIPGQCSHFAMRMECTRGGAASISSWALHYNKDEAS